jgi:PX domain
MSHSLISASFAPRKTILRAHTLARCSHILEVVCAPCVRSLGHAMCSALVRSCALKWSLSYSLCIKSTYALYACTPLILILEHIHPHSQARRVFSLFVVTSLIMTPHVRVLSSSSSSSSPSSSSFRSLTHSQVYVVDVRHSNRRWRIFRRYKQFNQLDSQLRAVFPDLKHTLPVMPKKNYLRSSTSVKLVNERKQTLDNYLRELTELRWVVESDVFQSWLSIEWNVGSRNTYTHVHTIRAYTHTYTHTHTYTRTHTRTYTRIHTLERVLRCTLTFSCVQFCHRDIHPMHSTRVSLLNTSVPVLFFPFFFCLSVPPCLCSRYQDFLTHLYVHLSVCPFVWVRMSAFLSAAG